jgi:hypothetical protein
MEFAQRAADVLTTGPGYFKKTHDEKPSRCGGKYRCRRAKTIGIFRAEISWTGMPPVELSTLQGGKE